jgi:L-lactate dehydrogenase complex protein LldF
MWTGVTPGDGPQAFHLVLLDAGRTDTLSDGVGRQALRCIRCSACLNVCPVYERTGGRAYGSPYPGPIGAIITPQLRGIARHPVDKQTASLPYASSLCGACYDVCPVRIDIPEVLVHLRGKVVEHGWPAERGAGDDGLAGLGVRWAAAAVGRRADGRGGRGCCRAEGPDRKLPLPGMLGRWFRWRTCRRRRGQSFRSWWRARHGAPRGTTAVTATTARRAILGPNPRRSTRTRLRSHRRAEGLRADRSTRAST